MTIWPAALGTLSLSALAGTLVVPAARRVAFGDVTHDWIQAEVDFDHIAPDRSTIVCKNNVQFRIYEILGTSYDTKPFESQKALHNGRTALLHELATFGVSARFFGIKRQKDISQPARWPSPVLEEIGQAENEIFRNAYEIRWFFVVQSPEPRALAEAHEKILTLADPYTPNLLKTPEDPSAPCPITSFLNFLTCGDLRDDLRPESVNITGNLQAADTVWDCAGGLMTTHLPVPVYTRMIAVRGWPETVDGTLLHRILCLPGELEISHVLQPIRKETASAVLARKSREVQGTPFGNATLGEECDAGLELLNAGDTSFFRTQCCIAARARTMAALDTLTEQVCRELGRCGAKTSLETSCLMPAWFNRLPGRERLARPLKLRNDDLAALWVWPYAPVGLTRSTWGTDPVRLFATASGQAYAFQFQADTQKKSLGNFCVFAPSGVGKSTLMMHLFGGLARLDRFKTFILDSKEGARFMVEAMGGSYQNFDRLALNPLDVEADTPAARQRIGRLLRTMIGDADGEDNLDEIQRHLLNLAFQLPPGERTFNGLFETCFPPRSKVRRDFARWVTTAKGAKGAYSHVFNAPRDTVSAFLKEAFMVAINMNEALEDPVLAPPVVTHLSTAIENIARSGDLNGFAIFIDEAANLLRNEAFKSHVRWMFREYRKLSGAVGMAFQDPGALFSSGVADAVIENTACFFFFPNPQGNREAYDAFRLNDEQKEFIWGGRTEGRKVLLIKRDAATGFEESVVLDVDLSRLGDALRFYRSGPDAVRELESAQKKWGPEWIEKL